MPKGGLLFETKRGGSRFPPASGTKEKNPVLSVYERRREKTVTRIGSMPRARDIAAASEKKNNLRGKEGKSGQKTGSLYLSEKRRRRPFIEK